MTVLMLGLGVLAGALTTVTGMGGGVLLLLALSLLTGPAEALAISSPGLLVGNLHRLALGRREVDRRVAGAFALGAFPGSLAGGLLAVALPPMALQALLLLATAGALARSLGLWMFRASPATLVPAGFGIGAAAASAGAGGLLVGPVLMASGLSGARFIATTAAVAVAIHLGRIAAYGMGGLVTPATLAQSAALALALMLGNTLGEQIRKRLDPRLAGRLELGVLLACVALALVGLA